MSGRNKIIEDGDEEGKVQIRVWKANDKKQQQQKQKG